MAKQPTTAVAVKETNSLESAVARIQYLREKKLLPAGIKTDEQALMVIAMGDSLGMTDMVALQSLEFIQGNLTVKAKMVSGLLAKAGISTKIIADYEPVYTTVLKPIPLWKTNDDGSTEPVFNKEGKPCYVLNEDGSVKTREEQKETDRVTTIEFQRHYPHIGVVSNTVSFYWSDAVNAGWDTKHNWKSNPRYMMTARALTRGARLIAADIIGGLYDNLEMADVEGQVIPIED